MYGRDAHRAAAPSVTFAGVCDLLSSHTLESTSQHNLKFRKIIIPNYVSNPWRQFVAYDASIVRCIALSHTALPSKAGGWIWPTNLGL